jgi:glycosyltransferase involved in cell wall biosynthesis
VAVVTAGNGASIPDLDFRQWHLGMLGDDRSLALAYSAADVFVSPSVEDAGPMMVNEAMACGVPVVATAVGTAPDFIRDGETGWLAGVHDPFGLARGMAALLHANDRDGFGHRCRRVAVERFAPAVVAASYMQLYRDLRSP